jgi:hypothetical protein
MKETPPMPFPCSALTDAELSQLAQLLAAAAVPGSFDGAHRDIEAIGAELWRRLRTAEPAAGMPVP